MLGSNFVSSSNDIAYATLLNADGKGLGRDASEPDAFLQRELERAYQAAREGRVYSGEPLVVGGGNRRGPSCWSVRRSHTTNVLGLSGRW